MTTPAVRIVPMTAAHIDALMAHERAMFGTEAWTRGGYRSELADRRHRAYLAVEDADGRLLAWGGVRVLADEAEILTIGVVPDARRRGIARLLLAELLGIARERGAAHAYLEVRIDNEAARALYLREGFAELGVRRGYYNGGRVDGVTMHRAL